VIFYLVLLLLARHGGARKNLARVSNAPYLSHSYRVYYVGIIITTPWNIDRSKTTKKDVKYQCKPVYYIGTVLFYEVSGHY